MMRPSLTRSSPPASFTAISWGICPADKPKMVQPSIPSNNIRWLLFTIHQDLKDHGARWLHLQDCTAADQQAVVCQVLRPFSVAKTNDDELMSAVKG
ncbi:hypothetical protein GJAV_G00206260 [Gymnothorax javanicus]|nr:hypothetical protein GJAV_G00206260 [Gymnothorax javanicus]